MRAKLPGWCKSFWTSAEPFLLGQIKNHHTSAAMMAVGRGEMIRASTSCSQSWLIFCSPKPGRISFSDTKASEATLNKKDDRLEIKVHNWTATSTHKQRSNKTAAPFTLPNSCSSRWALPTRRMAMRNASSSDNSQARSRSTNPAGAIPVRSGSHFETQRSAPSLRASAG